VHPEAREQRPRLVALRALAADGSPAARTALLAALRDPAFPDRADAALTLGRIPHAESIEPLLEALGAPEPELRRAAARSLGMLAVAHVVLAPVGSRVLDAMEARYREEPEPMVRAALFRAILDLGGDRAFNTAFGLTRDDDDPLVRCEWLRAKTYFAQLAATDDALAGARRATRTILAELGPDDEPRTLARARMRARAARLELNGQCPDLLVEATLALATLRDPEAPRLLGELAATGAPPVRAAAIEGLGRLGGAAALRACVAALDDPRWGVRRKAIEALGRLEDPTAGEVLAATVREGSTLDRSSAARALAHVPHGSAALVDAFADPVVPVREAAEDSLLQHANSAETFTVRLWALEQADAGSPDLREQPQGEALLEARRQTERWSRVHAADAAVLAAALSREDPRVHRRAARVLAAFPGDAARLRLVGILSQGVPAEAQLAAFALGLRGDEAARDALERAAATNHPGVAVAAIRALQDLGEPASAPLLRGLAENSPWEEVRAAALMANAMLAPEPDIEGAGGG
jgi:HEAT repeat protein